MELEFGVVGRCVESLSGRGLFEEAKTIYTIFTSHNNITKYHNHNYTAGLDFYV
jgi:hypothetical protein